MKKMILKTNGSGKLYKLFETEGKLKRPRNIEKYITKERQNSLVRKIKQKSQIPTAMVFTFSYYNRTLLQLP